MKVLHLLALAVVVLFTAAVPVLAADTTALPYEKDSGTWQPPNNPVFSGRALGAGLGAGLTLIGAGYGFSRIGSAALESMARQPEVAGRVQTAMIIIAALLEGATFFALIVCIMLVGKATF